MTPASRLALAVVPDLYFAARIAATAKAAGVELELVAPEHAAARITAGGAPALVLVDLHAPQAMALVATCKRAAPETPLVGFYSHVETALRAGALAAGADAALPRSAFVTKLAGLLADGLRALEPGYAPFTGPGAPVDDGSGAPA